MEGAALLEIYWDEDIKGVSCRRDVTCRRTHKFNPGRVNCSPSFSLTRGSIEWTNVSHLSDLYGINKLLAVGASSRHTHTMKDPLSAGMLFKSFSVRR
jgi:hypothetical protein